MKFKFDFGQELQHSIIFSLVIIKDKRFDYWLIKLNEKLPITLYADQ